LKVQGKVKFRGWFLNLANFVRAPYVWKELLEHGSAKILEAKAWDKNTRSCQQVGK